MARMDDSPLSIIASIAGILTFIAALCAFIYVRYATLRNGRTELATIVESVAATIEETRAIHIAQLGSNMQPTGSSDAYSGRLNKLVSELYTIERDIIAQCMNISGLGSPAMQSTWRPNPVGINVDVNTMWDDMLKELEAMQKRLASQKNVVDQWLQFVPTSGQTYRDLSLLSTIIFHVISLGSTPTMMRWYMVREKVLQLLQRREIIRSRQLFHQISVANSAARSQEALICDLVMRNDLLEARLSQLSHLAIEPNGLMQRRVHDNDESKDRIVRLTDPPDKYDETQKPATPIA